MTDFSIGQQIEEVEREIALREDVYQRKYAGRDKSRGEFHLARMRAVQKSLEWLRDNKAEIVDAIKARKAQTDPCPDCAGAGGTMALVDGAHYRGPMKIPCRKCNGSGRVNKEVAA